ncbi:hypothetical protein [Burkholderia lata]|uniref:Uncharacterized protein n=1 Tax=Burkholderia lata (strain ATCC 17760 / DSM 23089 / LMG 22485 / NCIMB 9086 / R18194 / 383) TaxID=482957 RepID=A0A6P2R903_BURL3|nr:hypothetical protein [Burkholderia lata]VWC31240.1 hypothetical protein BLA15945_06455 [Burkholderia lata]
MACTIRFAGVVRASAPRRLPDARATQRRDDGHGARRLAKHSRHARRDAVACRIAWPAFEASDAPADGSPS